MADKTATRRLLACLEDTAAADVVGRLSEAQAQVLLDLLDVARERQRAALAQASEQSLRHVPALLRPAVRRVLMGETR